MQHIEAPESGDPAVLKDGTECTIILDHRANYTQETELWEVSLQVGDQELHGRTVQWKAGKWVETEEED